jgi:hypothetical protein
MCNIGLGDEQRERLGARRGTLGARELARTRPRRLPRFRPYIPVHLSLLLDKLNSHS